MDAGTDDTQWAAFAALRRQPSPQRVFPDKSSASASEHATSQAFQIMKQDAPKARIMSGSRIWACSYR
ncbi:hypothetical protein OA90_02590 [Labrenzia sp. OB1]|nr:hypothetical protein OA90_02590 [Labrenzia sp. OB1]